MTGVPWVRILLPLKTLCRETDARVKSVEAQNPLLVRIECGGGSFPGNLLLVSSVPLGIPPIALVLLYATTLILAGIPVLRTGELNS
ncbi:hypothetical protein TNCV_2803971 [Trichonephila clavipes]|nr:hypothetical protein TNCV_2803971 [Trichonephila clavipes]